MNRIDVLWVDLRLRRLPDSLPRGVASACRVAIVHCAEDIQPMVRAARPDAIAFDFDCPDVPGLQALLDTRQRFAHIPVLMLTEQCYDNLLLWALRARVWDVLVKPVTEDGVRQRLARLRAARSATDLGGTRSNAMPAPAIPVEARLAASSVRSRRTDTVRSYVEDHLCEKLSATELAHRYGMSRYEFSRTFHDEHGVTYRDYLLSARLHRAAEMLRRTDAPVTEVAFCVGYHDLSHFDSQFRRHTGCSPSEFRQRHREAH